MRDYFIQIFHTCLIFDKQDNMVRFKLFRVAAREACIKFRNGFAGCFFSQPLKQAVEYFRKNGGVVTGTVMVKIPEIKRLCDCIKFSIG